MAGCLSARNTIVTGALFVILSAVFFALASGLPNWDYQCLHRDDVPVYQSAALQSGTLCRKVGLWEFCVKDQTPLPAPWTEGAP